MSRNRKYTPRKSATSHRNRPREPFRSVASQMTPAHHRAVEESAAAELRHDLATALELHRSVPMFVESPHGDRLQQLLDLGDDAPGWLISRWMTVIARRRAWAGAEAAAHHVLPIVVPAVFPDRIPFEKIGCRHVEQVAAWIWERDWAVRQFDVHEFGALETLVEHQASPELIERADQVAAWCDAPMGGFRLEGRGADRDSVRLRDLADDQLVDILDLGLAEQVQAGQHLLGRLVPTAIGPGRMLDWQPLPVDARTAELVARYPDRWLSLLGERAEEGALPLGFSYRPEASLTADLHRHAWVALLDRPVDLPLDTDPAPLAEEALAAALSFATADPASLGARRHLLGELLLDGALDDRARSRFARPDLVGAWQALAEAVPDPARGRCLEMVLWSDAAVAERAG